MLGNFIQKSGTKSTMSIAMNFAPGYVSYFFLLLIIVSIPMTDPTWTLQISSIELLELLSGSLIWFSITYILQMLKSLAKQGLNKGIFSLMFFLSKLS